MRPVPPACEYLNFDATDNGDGTGTWEAMASAPAGEARLGRMLAEAHGVLAWVGWHAPGPRGPMEDGGEWDADIAEDTHDGWTTITLTITGPWLWGEQCITSCQNTGGPRVA